MSMSTMQYDGCFPNIPNVSVTSGSEPCSDAESKKMNGETKKAYNIKQESSQIRDQSLSNKEVDRRSKLEFNLLDFLEGKSTNASESSRNARKAERQRTYNCQYCHRKYSNVHALGGHQNAHKRERALEKIGNTVNDAAAGALEHTNSMLYPYSGMAGVPMQRSFNKTLGILMPSTIRKPYSHWLHGGHEHAYPDILRPQAEMHQPQNGVFHTLGMTGLRGGFQPVANMSTSSNHHQSNTSLSNQKGETLGLDLSLKL